MKKLILLFCLFSSSALAAGFPVNCPDTSGNHLNYLTATNIYSCGTSSGGGGSVTLGTSVSVNNPQRSGDATTGLYSAATSSVSIAAGGVQQVTSSPNNFNFGNGGAAETVNVFGNAATLNVSADNHTTGSINVGEQSSNCGGTGICYGMGMEYYLPGNIDGNMFYRITGGTKFPLFTFNFGDSNVNFGGNFTMDTSLNGTSNPTFSGKTSSGQAYVNMFQGGTGNMVIQSGYPTGAVTIAGGNVASEMVRIASNGDLGINDTGPASKLSVVGNAQIGYTAGQTSVTNGLIVSGSVGIGSSSPVYALDVNGGIRSNNANVLLTGIGSSTAAQNGTLCISGAGLVTYDPSLGCLTSLADQKTKIKAYKKGLDTVLALKPQTYFYKDKHDPDEQIGLIAEDVEKVDKKLVAYGSGGKLRGVRYEHLGVVDAAAIQELFAMMVERTPLSPPNKETHYVIAAHKCFFNLLLCPDEGKP